MSFRIVVDDITKFKVKGTIKNATGVDVPFDFTLTAKRLNTDEINTLVGDKSDNSVLDFLAIVLQDWSGVQDADGQPLPFSTDALRAMCKVPGVALLAFHTYFAEVGAKAKN